MTRYSKLRIAVAALAVAALAMFGASHLAAALFSAASIEVRHPLISSSSAALLSVGFGTGVTFFVIGVAIADVRSRASREARARDDRWAKLRNQHTQLAERILPPDLR